MGVCVCECVCVWVCEYLTKLTVRECVKMVKYDIPYITGKMSTEKMLLVKCPMGECLMGNCHGMAHGWCTTITND